MHIAGVCHITVDGKSLDISGGMTIPLSTSTKETIVSTNGSVHFKETPVAPFIDGTYLVTPDFPIEDLDSMTEGTIVAELANGKTYTLSDAWVEGEMDFESDGGTVGIKFVGRSGRWS